MSTLPDEIYRAAKRQGIGVEALRRKAGMSNGLFYDLLGGKPAKKVAALDKLEAAGVRIPGRAVRRPRRTDKAA